MVITTMELKNTLSNKGSQVHATKGPNGVYWFKEVRGRDHWVYFLVVDGLTKIIRTKVSFSNYEISDGLLSRICKQLKISKQFLLDFQDCTYNLRDYISEIEKELTTDKTNEHIVKANKNKLEKIEVVLVSYHFNFNNPGAGKTSILNYLTGAAENYIGRYSEVMLKGIYKYKELSFQIVELPRFKRNLLEGSEILSVLKTCNLICLCVDLSRNIEEQMGFLLEQLNNADNQLINKAIIVGTKGDLPNVKRTFDKLKNKYTERFSKILPTSIGKEKGFEEFGDIILTVLNKMVVTLVDRFGTPQRKIVDQNVTVGDISSNGVSHNVILHRKDEIIKVGSNYKLQDKDIIKFK